MIKRIISFILSVLSAFPIFSSSPVKNESVDKFSVIENTKIVGELNNDPFLNKINMSYMMGDSDTIWTSFNGVQIIKDKTAFANDYGVGGVFSWHYSCDVPYENDLSLFKAIQTSLDTRK